MKRRLLAPLFGGIVSFALIFTIASANGVLTFANEANAKWVHYAKKEATASSNGVREYWVKCGANHYQFEAPSSGTVEDALTYDLSEFVENDPRYIIYVPSSVSAFYRQSDSLYDFSEFSSSEYLLGDGYRVSNVSGVLGNSSRYEFVKDDKSPVYSAMCMTVTDTIGTNDELTALSKTIEKGDTDGYYVLTSDLSSPSGWTDSDDHLFKGVFDGRGHTIDKPITWGKRLFGKTYGATIKNVDFTNIEVFCVLGTELTDTTIENCSFSVGPAMNTASGGALLCDDLGSGSLLKDVYIDMGETSMKCSWLAQGVVSAIASYNVSSADDPVTYDNVTFRGLNSTKMYLFDAAYRGLRPSEINYISTYWFIKDGATNYDIKYVSGDENIQIAATMIKDEIYNATGKSLPLTAIAASDVYENQTSSIIVGSSASATAEKISLPTETSSYTLKGIGKAIYLNSADSKGYQLGALKLLDILVGYDYLGGEISTYDVSDVNNIDLPYIDISYTPSFGYRKCDWSDIGFSSSFYTDCYRLGYNTEFDRYSYYLRAPAVGTFASEECFHTSLQIIYPGTYYSSHPNWFAVDSSGNNYGSDYRLWQLCFTAHGDNAEYQSLLEQTASTVISLFKNCGNANIRSLLFGTGDSMNVCHCSTCEAKTSEYGSISGTVANFCNDLRDKIYENIAETGRDSVDIGFFSYCGYNSVPFKNGSPTITLKDNVYVLVAPIEANFTYSLNESCNSSLKEIFVNWAKVGDTHAWLYDTNFNNYLFPHNSFKSNAENIKILKDIGVKFIYLQGQHNSTQPRTGFHALKKYVHGKFMVDADNSDYDELLNDFFASYYGEGGNEMRTFYNEMVAHLESLETDSSKTKILYASDSRSIYAAINDRDLWDYDTLKSWASLCDAAYLKATTEKAKKHILAESIFPRFALCSLFTKYTDWNGGKVLDFSGTGKAALKAYREAFKTDADALGMTITTESKANTSLSDYYSDWGIA